MPLQQRLSGCTTLFFWCTALLAHAGYRMAAATSGRGAPGLNWPSAGELARYCSCCRAVPAPAASFHCRSGCDCERSRSRSHAAPGRIHSAHWVSASLHHLPPLSHFVFKDPTDRSMLISCPHLSLPPPLPAPLSLSLLYIKHPAAAASYHLPKIRISQQQFNTKNTQ
jgi:hypothetical protein